MTISVCMGLYNGEKYIEEQLLSILKQTRPADEVIFCDDGSKDHTVAIVRKFIGQYQLENTWHLHCNEENKGYPANFYHAMNLCTKDIVFLADQDDVWDERKLERMCHVFDKKPGAALISCKFGLIDTEGNPINTVMAPVHSKETGKLRPIFLEDVFYKCEWPGMVMAYRNAWYRQWRINVKEGGNVPEIQRVPHDFLLCVRASEEKKFWQLDEKLAYHRRHENNAGGEEHRLGRLLNKPRKIAEIETYLHMLERVKKGQVLQTREGRQKLEEKYSSMKDRYKALQSGKIRKVLANAVAHKKDVRLATVICDLMIVKF